jgi:hypothetical protein
MRRLEDEVRSCAEVALRLLSIPAPEQECDRLRLPGHRFDHRVGEELPILEVTTGRSLEDGHAGVEEQDPIPRPWDKRTVAIDRVTEIPFKFVQDVAKRRREWRCVRTE